DFIDGGLGVDVAVFSGLRSAYTITWNGQTATVVGPDGTDTLINVETFQFADQTVASQATGGLIVSGDLTDNTIDGTAFGDTIGGGGGTDIINGLGGADTLDGGSGNDVLNGGDGDDVLIGGLGTDTLNGGNGTGDVADYSTAFSGVTVSLAAVGQQSTGGAGLDQLNGVEGLTGSAFNDVLTGDGGANVLRGGGGVDTLNGGGGNDQLFAGAPGETGGAPDIVKGQATVNSAIGTAVSIDSGFDIVARAGVVSPTTIPHATVVATSSGAIEYYAFTVTAGAQVVFDVDGASFDSTLRIYSADGTQLASNDDEEGATGTDAGLTHTFATAGTYYVAIGEWDASLTGGGFTDVAPPQGSTYTLHVSVPGHAVVPTVFLGSTLNGEAGADALTGGTGIDTLNGGEGDDTLTGGLGNDILAGGDGSDTAVFGSVRSAYSVSTTNGVTTVSGPDGTDTLTGVEFLRFSDQTVTVGAPTNPGVVLTGTPGDDRLDGGTGDDTLTGQGGNDILVGYAGNDSMSGGAGDDGLWGSEGNDVMSGGDGADLMDGQDGNDALDGGAGMDILYGGLGNDTLTGGGDADLLFGQDGDDQMWAGDLNDWIWGGAGNDFLDGQGTGDNLFGEDGNDLIYGGDGADMIRGGAGVDIVNGDAGGDALYGDDGDDVIYGGAGANMLNGGAGNDQLFGGAEGELFYGEGGNDVITAGAGQDQIFGMGGADRFVFTALSDSIGAAPDILFDYNAAEGDVIDVTAIDANVNAAGDQDFVFASSFGGQAGQAVLNYDAASNRTSLWLDVNGDGAADSVIWIAGQVTTGAGWAGITGTASAPVEGASKVAGVEVSVAEAATASAKAGLQGPEVMPWADGDGGMTPPEARPQADWGSAPSADLRPIHLHAHLGVLAPEHYWLF
ncbi:MAG TPA: calcium-binding protein, partial [Caulobacteraceae bacterium]